MQQDLLKEKGITMPDYLFRVDIRFSALDDVEARRKVMDTFNLRKNASKEVSLRRLKPGKPPELVSKWDEAKWEKEQIRYASMRLGEED